MVAKGMGGRGTGREGYEPKLADAIDPWLGRVGPGDGHQSQEMASDLGMTPEAYERLEADAAADSRHPARDPHRAGLVDRLLARLERWAHSGSGHELAMLSEGQRQELARDLALNVGELDRLATADTSMPDLVYRRLGEIGFTVEEAVASGIASRVDLERTCALCDGRATCAHDLAERPDSPEWRQYCPNNETFKALEAALTAKAPVKPPEK